MPNPKQKPKRKRRWFRYSLRTLLIFVTIFCVVLGYWTHRTNRQKAVVKWVEENGGFVTYDFEFDEKGELIDDAKPPGPEWVQAFLGDDYVASVVRVEIEDNELKDVAPLAKLKQLKYLYLANTQVTDLTPLTGLKSLKVLWLHDTQISELKPLAGLVSLELLWLDSTQVSNLTPLAGLTNLQELTLRNTQVSDLTPLAELTSLDVLNLCNTQVSDLTPLMQLTSLEHLYLDNTQVTDLTPLMGLTSLGVLTLDNLQFTQEQVNVLQSALPNCFISWSPPDKAIEGN